MKTDKIIKRIVNQVAKSEGYEQAVLQVGKAIDAGCINHCWLKTKAKGAEVIMNHIDWLGSPQGADYWAALYQKGLDDA